MIQSMQEALKAIERKGYKPLTRYVYTDGDYSVGKALELAETIGKSRDPKFTIDGDNRFVYENFAKWLHCDTTVRALDPDTREAIPGGLKKGIYIAGGVGTGKTMCTEVMAAYAEVFCFRIMFGEQEGNVIWRSERADGIVESFIREKDTGRYRERHILCIQDFGSETTEAVSMGYRTNVMRSLLEYRGDKPDRLTIITSNYPMASPALKEIYGERVTSRLRQMCNYYEIKGKDRRRA